MHDHVFAPANAATAGQIAYEVRDALERWEPRIDVERGRRRLRRGRRRASLYIDVHYRSAAPTTRATWSFPFYVIPEEPASASCSAALRNGDVTMALPAPNLDDRHFQDLVDDAKRLVQQRCPEWTDHNVSDPGVTLIETFA